jgi:hypothetical protein
MRSLKASDMVSDRRVVRFSRGDLQVPIVVMGQARKYLMKLRKSGSGAFILGAGSVLDIGAVRSFSQQAPGRPRARSVKEALRSDLTRVGHDLERGLERVRESQP